MGTHPIFESDFDCLTDSQRLQQWHHRSQKHSKRSAPPTRPLSPKRPSPSRTPSELESSSDVLSSSALRLTPRPTLTRSVSRSLASVKPKRTETSMSPESPNSPLLSASVVSTRSLHVSRRSFSFSDSDKSEMPFLSNLIRLPL